MEHELPGKGPLLIRDVKLEGERVDILVDDRGTIAAVGHDVGRTMRGEADRVIEGGGARSCRASSTPIPTLP